MDRKDKLLIAGIVFFATVSFVAFTLSIFFGFKEIEDYENGEHVDEMVETTTGYDENKKEYADKMASISTNKEGFNIADNAYLDREIIHSEEVDGVYTDIHGISLTRANTKEINVYVGVRNTTNSEHSVPLMNAVVVSENGAQSSVNVAESIPPEWNLHPNAKDKGVITFEPLNDPDFGEGSAFTIYFPGVDFEEENDWEWYVNY